MKIVRKWLEDNAVNGQKFRLDNNEYARGRNAANTADINILRVNASNRVEFPAIPQATGTPVASQDLVTVGFLENYITGFLDPKNAVRAASTTQLALTGGATLTVDGVSLVNTDRVLLAGQTSAIQNGIYTVSGIGTAYALTRSTDADGPGDLTQGAYTKVIEGTVYAGWEFTLTTLDPITIGTTPLVWAGQPASTTYLGGDMVTVTGNTITLDLAAVSGLESSNPGNAAGQLRAKVHAPALQKDKTVRINASNEIESLKARKQVYTLVAGDITNGYVDLDRVAHESSLFVTPGGGPTQEEAVDYTLNYTGGSGGNTRVTFAGDLTSLLAAGDKLYVQYKFIS